ncbi:MAG: isomerizing glutamine--fructose-6-phosphate transaminase, partial [Chloroflexota bacterium]|nr:isomerizing glutamine--fructose-6-phosphate transaminase [Chloroflexota bacterium]
MCGVFGYVGQSTDVGDAVVTALKTLEYRGYDSWGIAVSTPDRLIIDKSVGRINGHHRAYPEGCIGFGHTRWATHGGATRANAHPHRDCSGSIAVVHNGIIENHTALRAALIARGHQFTSETDSEIVAHLVEEQLATGESFASAVADSFDRLHGYNAIVVMDRVGQQLAATKCVSPLVIGQGALASTIASDSIALRGHADQLVFLEDHHLAVLTKNGTDFYERSTMKPLSPCAIPNNNRQESIELGDYPDFLSKEVSEQPGTLRRLIDEAHQEITELAVKLRAAKRVVLVGSGTAGNAAIAGTYVFSQLCRRDVSFFPASEFRYRSAILDSESLVIALSQSGETVDVLDAMTDARARGSQLAAIVNSPNSTLNRFVETSVMLRAGVEQCVLATKSYTAMLAVLLLTAYEVREEWDRGAAAVGRATEAVEHVLDRERQAHMFQIARDLADAGNLFVIGRG